MYTFGNSIRTQFQNAYKSNGNVTKMDTSNFATSKLLIFATKIKQKWCAIGVQFQKCQYLLGFKGFLNSAQHTSWAASKAPATSLISVIHKMQLKPMKSYDNHDISTFNMTKLSIFLWFLKVF